MNTVEPDAKLRVGAYRNQGLCSAAEDKPVYVQHAQIEALTMADKIVVMHDGIVEQIGTPVDLYDKPDNQFVAGFIGSPAMKFPEVKGRANAAPASKVRTA